MTGDNAIWEPAAMTWPGHSSTVGRETRVSLPMVTRVHNAVAGMFFAILLQETDASTSLIGQLPLCFSIFFIKNT